MSVELPRVSIIIPCYNAEEYVGEAILSNRFNRSLPEIETRTPGTRGALRGSWPSHQGYGRYWSMNWTQKFFLNALLAESGLRVC